MNCAKYRQALQEQVDGTLGSIRAAELEQHLAECSACSALATDLQRVHDLAASLDHSAPPDGVWLQIAGRLRQEGRVQPAPPVHRARQSRVTILAIAATLTLAVGGSLIMLTTYLQNDDQPATQTSGQSTGNTAGDESVQNIEDHFRVAEQHMQAGITKLEEAARAGESVIDPQTATLLKKNLEMIDLAMAESRAALKTEPQSAIARDSLFNAMRRKVALLQDTIALMNEMRKGDAAGAAQVIERSNKS
jgi:hypothetical protein